jgi:hypothetical protein
MTWSLVPNSRSVGVGLGAAMADRSDRAARSNTDS